jgi:hypothetical protein
MALKVRRYWRLGSLCLAMLPLSETLATSVSVLAAAVPDGIAPPYIPSMQMRPAGTPASGPSTASTKMTMELGSRDPPRC